MPGRPLVGVSAGKPLSSRGQAESEGPGQSGRTQFANTSPSLFNGGRGGRGQRNPELEVDQGHGQISGCCGDKGEVRECHLGATITPQGIVGDDWGHYSCHSWGRCSRHQGGGARDAAQHPNLPGTATPRERPSPECGGDRARRGPARGRQLPSRNKSALGTGHPGTT